MKPLKKYLSPALIVLYATGILGFGAGSLRPLFLSMVPGFLVLSLGLLLLEHPQWDRKSLFWMLKVFITGWCAEWVGVHTGAIFGNYEYSGVLGWSLDGIPLVIGINWLILAYCSYDLAGRLFHNKILRNLLASGLMVLLDLLIEPVAIWLNFWQWEGGRPPFQNYLGWFVISFLLFIAASVLRIDYRNRISATLYLCLFLFFSALNFYAGA